MNLLFSYGTLQQESVQLANFGRTLTGEPDALPCYKVETITITDKRVITLSGKNTHPILRYTGHIQDEVYGTVFELTDDEILQADEYEVDDYKRVTVKLKSGRTCWLYSSR